jgi:hypothetical protein
VPGDGTARTTTVRVTQIFFESRDLGDQLSRPGVFVALSTGRATEKLAKETGRLFLSLVKGVISR